MMRLFVIFVLCLLMTMEQVDADLIEELDCICSVNHPQELFCKSDFAFVGTVQSAEDLKEVYSYEITIFDKKVFKGLSYISAEATSVTLLTPYATSLCGRTNLIPEAIYLFTGGYYEGKLVMTFCDWVQEWNTISPEQQYYLENKYYLDHCGFCEIESVKSEMKQNQNGNGLVYNGQVSGLWTPYGCYFNPVASATYYGKVDCETSFSYCRPSDHSSRCDWELTDSYVECFGARESYWSSRKNQQAAAYLLDEQWTSIKQCKAIKNNRKLKRRCINEVKAYLKSQRNEMKPVDMLEELMDLRDLWLEDDDLDLLSEE